MTPEQIDLLEEFCRFLEKEGYLDADWYAEEPTAIQRFIEYKESKP